MINLGDVVRLNSGSPAMTVIKIETYEIRVTWMCDGITRETTFPSACVKSSEKDGWSKD